MNSDDSEFIYKGISVTYKFRGAKQDRRHLLVVFSGGFGENKRYDLSGATSEGIRSDILWIRDRFEGEFSYYIQTSKLGTLVADAVTALIAEVRVQRGLEKRHCTFIGFSKGGSAALFHGITSNYPNIIAVAPRMNIGTANKVHRPHILAQLVKNCDDGEVVKLDRLVPDLLSNDANRSRNIYLFTSPADRQYASEVLPFIPSYQKYDNFNYVVSSSPIVVRHQDVTTYNVPLILATIYALVEGAVPKYGMVANGYDSFKSSLPAPTLENVRAREEVVFRLSSLKLREERIYAEGILFIKGIPIADNSLIKRSLVLKSAETAFKYVLDSSKDERITKDFFENEYCDYSFGKFLSINGISLRGVPKGTYSVGIELEHAGVTKYFDALPDDAIDSSIVTGNRVMRFKSTDEGMKLLISSTLASTDCHCHFALRNSWVTGNAIHVEGRFVLPGVRTDRRGDVRYFIVLAAKGSRKPLKSIRLATSQRKFLLSSAADPLRDYRFTYFNTPGGKGLELPNIDSGIYDVFITAVSPNVVASQHTGKQLQISNNGGRSSKQLISRSEVETKPASNHLAKLPLYSQMRKLRNKILKFRKNL